MDLAFTFADLLTWLSPLLLPLWLWGLWRFRPDLRLGARPRAALPRPLPHSPHAA